MTRITYVDIDQVEHLEVHNLHAPTALHNLTCNGCTILFVERI